MDLVLPMILREQLGREASPTAAVTDSQTLKAAENRRKRAVPALAFSARSGHRWFPLALSRLNSCDFPPLAAVGWALTVPVRSFSAERQSAAQFANPRRSDPP